MKISFIIIVLLVAHTNILFAEEPYRDVYLKIYIEQLIPILKERLSTEMSFETEEAANEHITLLANRMAECQLIAIENYPQKYKDASIHPVIDGKDITTVNSDVNAQMQADIDSGELSKQDFKTMVETTTENYKVCVSYPQ